MATEVTALLMPMSTLTAFRILYIFIIVIAEQCTVIAQQSWEDFHHKTAFAEILNNPNPDVSWRYGIDSGNMTAPHMSNDIFSRNNNTIELHTNTTRLSGTGHNGAAANGRDYGGTVRRHKRFSDGSTFQGKPKTREERWHQNFNMNATNLQLDQASSLVMLLNKVVERYMMACIPIVFYDDYVEHSDGIILQTFFQQFQLSYIHGKIDESYRVSNQNLLHPSDKRCRSYILFLSDVVRAREVLGPQITNRVIIVPRSTQWKLQEFLSSKASSDIINLLVVGESLSSDYAKERPYVLYTHKLYTDGLGSNTPVVLTSWIKGKLSRPHVNLFPAKFLKGFSGHRFMVTAIHQPPYVMKKLSTDGVGNINIAWDGVEIRLLRIIGQRLNFSYEVLEPKIGNPLGPTYGIVDLVAARRADIGLAGAYVSVERINKVEMSTQHSGDCAAFITLASKALPRYRAIMGPFQWPVWVAIIATYLLAIFPLAYSDRLTLSHLIGNYAEIENMFWYVFGTFTNSLTFTGEFSWSRTKKTSTRMLIGWYWVFSIIITACYTSSIIAFVTLPVFPDTIDSINDLVYGFFRIGTFATDGWQYWFANSSHPQTKRLFKDLELVANVEEGLGNVTRSFFWQYAFLASRAQLEYIVQNNYTDESVGKRSALHIGEECLAIFGISIMFPKDSVYSERFNDFILRLSATGLIAKINTEMSWDLQRSSTGKLLQSGSSKTFKITEAEERKLNLADTEGMFLLMGVGYIVAGSVLVSEIVGGCAQRCRQFLRRNSTLTSIKSSFHPNTSAQPSTASQSQTHPIYPPLESVNSRKSSLFKRFRRKSDQANTVVSNDALSLAKHKRHNSLVSGFGRKSSSGRGSLEQIIDVHQSNEYDEEYAEVGIPVEQTVYMDDESAGHVEGKGDVHNDSIAEDVMEDSFGEKINRQEVY